MMDPRTLIVKGREYLDQSPLVSSLSHSLRHQPQWSKYRILPPPPFLFHRILFFLLEGDLKVGVRGWEGGGGAVPPDRRGAVFKVCGGVRGVGVGFGCGCGCASLPGEHYAVPHGAAARRRCNGNT